MLLERPDPYMPYRPRLNPHVEGARRHSKRWAQEIGILGGDDSNVWNEERFDSADFALFAARTYPDAPAAELDLLTDWGVWLFFFDDFIKTYKAARDRSGARAALQRLTARLSLEDGVALPTPRNAVERGLADLWGRTLPGTSRHWRRRFAESTRSAILEGPLWELGNFRQGRFPNPIEYIEMRRKVGGAPWAADLVEHALSIEIPAQIAASRPIRVLQDTFSDGVHLRNDLYSYDKEIEEEGEIHNGVLVIEHFLGCPPQRAADLVDDLATSRMHQFEHTIAVELPLLFEESALGASERVDVLRYVKGLQDWMAGDHEWHQRTSRYGQAARSDAATSAPPRRSDRRRLAAHLRPVPPDALSCGRGVRAPEVAFPRPARINPGVEALRVHTRRWTRAMGMLEPSAGVFGAWDERTLEAADFAACAALTHPDAAALELTLVSDWAIWGFHLDDVFVASFKRPRNLIGAKLFLDRLRAFVPADSTATPPPGNSVERSLADLWQRSAPFLSEARRRRCSRLAQDHLDSYLWELASLILRRLPDSIDYVEMRRKSFGAEWAAEMVALAAGLELSAEMRRHPALAAAVRCFSDVAGLRNDLVSHGKETIEGEMSNSVLVIQQLLDADVDEAAAVVHRLGESRRRQLEMLITTELEMPEDDLDEHTQTQLRGYARALEDWLAGYFRWAATSGRYRILGTQVPTASGLGTSAARAAAALRERTSRSA